MEARPKAKMAGVIWGLHLTRLCITETIFWKLASLILGNNKGSEQALYPPLHCNWSQFGPQNHLNLTETFDS